MPICGGAMWRCCGVDVFREPLDELVAANWRDHDIRLQATEVELEPGSRSCNLVRFHSFLLRELLFIFSASSPLPQDCCQYGIQIRKEKPS
jgi:hypothetical protein